MEEHKEQSYIRAKKRVKKLKIFYFHLIGYIVSVVLLCYNLWIVAGPYKDFFIWFNIIIMIAWGIIMVFHALHVFKGKSFFTKNWEEKKVREYMNEKTKTTKWE
ncbi:2TM domain-containing protein [uncultured Algibacter sp.]|uniref:2TM domain-containing protein n=1 Tax=uncultured Algibacter sp. TaxID=298659 RepID=UPI002631AEDD|nr:2TM domain-containing protein [uncultured Algibacter sp.]